MCINNNNSIVKFIYIKQNMCMIRHEIYIGFNLNRVRENKINLNLTRCIFFFDEI